jgi:hypothetical protein
MSRIREVTANELIDLVRPDSLDAGRREFYGPLRLLPISPEDRLYLNVWGHGDDARFAGIFRDTWFKIPVEDRMQLIDYWKPWERIPGVLGISIKMENLSTLRSQKTTAVCELLGTALNFYSPVVDRMPPKHVAALVAHELAHVFQATRGTLTAPERPAEITDKLISELATAWGTTFVEAERKLLYQSSPVESDADAIAERWGFKVRAMRRWLDRHVDWEDLPKPAF